MIQLLIKKSGANVNWLGGKYGTALHAASRWGHESVARFLVEIGADVNAQGGEFGTALQAAAACVWGQEPVVQFLIEMGADVNAQGGMFGTALQAAAVQGYQGVVRLLIENGAHHSTPLWVAAAKAMKLSFNSSSKVGANLDLQGHYGTALQAASVWDGNQNAYPRPSIGQNNLDAYIKSLFNACSRQVQSFCLGPYNIVTLFSPTGHTALEFYGFDIGRKKIRHFFVLSVATIDGAEIGQNVNRDLVGFDIARNMPLNLRCVIVNEADPGPQSPRRAFFLEGAGLDSGVEARKDNTEKDIILNVGCTSREVYQKPKTSANQQVRGSTNAVCMARARAASEWACTRWARTRRAGTGSTWSPTPVPARAARHPLLRPHAASPPAPAPCWSTASRRRPSVLHANLQAGRTRRSVVLHPRPARIPVRSPPQAPSPPPPRARPVDRASVPPVLAHTPSVPASADDSSRRVPAQHQHLRSADPDTPPPRPVPLGTRPTRRPAPPPGPVRGVGPVRDLSTSGTPPCPPIHTRRQRLRPDRCAWWAPPAATRCATSPHAPRPSTPPQRRSTRTSAQDPLPTLRTHARDSMRYGLRGSGGARSGHAGQVPSVPALGTRSAGAKDGGESGTRADYGEERVRGGAGGATSRAEQSGERTHRDCVDPDCAMARTGMKMRAQWRDERAKDKRSNPGCHERSKEMDGWRKEALEGSQVKQDHRLTKAPLYTVCDSGHARRAWMLSASMDRRDGEEIGREEKEGQGRGAREERVPA
ncbi:hypothetical protein FB451DRAFT_1380336 [Mycena latifolia]|nr:hypothetical protein FB451DRAFT_1380336 [Mycena latifolia]